MRDLKSPKAIWLKAGLFLFVGGLASTLLLLEYPTLKVAILLALAIWAFARAYYFAFYVIQHYLDSSFHYAGLWSVFRYMLKAGGGSDGAKSPGTDAKE